MYLIKITIQNKENSLKLRIKKEITQEKKKVGGVQNFNRHLTKEDIYRLQMETEMAANPSTLAWRIPRAEELGRLQFTESQRVIHN